ncbi:hypothetical protein B0H13DRAFT_2016337 [Mycena leptocephala]|nr:hypothetical protein B0H13DRAFT_2016337 [Mycena leptocephala]
MDPGEARARDVVDGSRRGCARAYMSSRSRSRSGRHDDLLPRRRPLPASPPSSPSPPSPRLYPRGPRPRHRPRARRAAWLQHTAHSDVMCGTSRRTCMRMWGGPRPRRPRPHSHARRPHRPRLRHRSAYDFGYAWLQDVASPCMQTCGSSRRGHMGRAGRQSVRGGSICVCGCAHHGAIEPGVAHMCTSMEVEGGREVEVEIDM